MNKKIVMFVALIAQNFCMYAMDIELVNEKPINPSLGEEQEDTSFLPMSNPKRKAPKVYVGGKAVTREKEGKKELGEEVDLTQIDPIAKVSFRTLITQQHKKGMAYILAVLLMKNKKGKYERRYQDATSLVKRMFNHYMRRTKNTHITARYKIENPIYFFTLFPNDTNFEYFISEDELIYCGLTPRTAFFCVNVGIEDDASFLIDAGIFCDAQQKYKAGGIYYLKAIALEDWLSHGLALYNYAFNCWHNKEYEKAKEYALMAARDHGRIDENLLTLLGLIHKHKKEYVQAASYFIKVYEMRDKYGMVHQNAKNNLLDMVRELSEKQKLSNESK